MLALVGVAIGAVLGDFFQRSAAAISRRELWSDRASETLADVELLLTDAYPHRVMFNMNRDTVTDDVKTPTARGVTARRGAAVLSVGCPDPRVRALAGELDVAIFNEEAMVERLHAAWFKRWRVQTMPAPAHIDKARPDEKA